MECQSILFVCTGNVFRSLSAEIALRSFDPARFIVSSAGTEAGTFPVHPVVKEHLKLKGHDVSTHTPTLLTESLLLKSNYIVSMSTDHREKILSQFGVKSHLFQELAWGKSEPLLDLEEKYPDYRANPERSVAYIKEVIDHIFDSIPNLADRIVNGNSNRFEL